MNARPRRLLDDCFLHDSDRLRHDDALALLRKRLSTVAQAEDIGLASASGRVAAAPVVAPRNIPAFDNAAVDGYAVRHSDLSPDGETELVVSGRVPAGHPLPGEFAAGTAVRIFTGAVMPRGTDTVLMQEDCSAGERDGRETVTIPPGIRAGANRRKAGEDVSEGDTLVRTGDRLRAQDLAAVASTGVDRISCFRPLRVALLSTGDELLRPGEPFVPGKVYDSNHFLLSALLAGSGCAVTDLGVLPDRADAVHRAIEECAEHHDLIVSSGGASRGEEDHVVDILNRLGTLHAWQLAVKPGRPLAFGQIADTVYLGLPGNPVAVMVCFLLYARPMIAALQGAHWPEPQRFRLPAGFGIDKKKTDRREFLRGWIDNGPDTGPVLRKYPRDGSGLISSLRAADGLIEIAEEVAEVREGDLLSYIPFSELGIPPASPHGGSP